MEPIDLIVFDVDGVLLDVHGSFPRVVEDTARHFLGEREGGWTQPHEITAFKQAGGFNSDWDLAAAVIWSQRQDRVELRRVAQEATLAGGGLAGLRRALGLGGDGDPPFVQVAAAASEIYAGSAHVEAMFGLTPHLQPPRDGYWQREKLLADPYELLMLPVRKAIYTGRTLGELQLPLELHGLAPVFAPDYRITSDGPYRKPDGAAITYLASLAQARSVLMVGDGIDDLHALKQARAQDPGRSYSFCGVAGGALGARAEEIFSQSGADAVAPSTETLIEWLREAG